MAFPTTGILDNFNRSNEGPPPSSYWSSDVSDGWKVVSNKMVPGTDVAHYCDAFWSTPYSGAVEFYYTIDTDSANATIYHSLYFFMQSTNWSVDRGYLLQYVKTPAPVEKIVLYRDTDGSYTELRSVNQAVDAGDKIGISVSAAGVMQIWFYDASGAATWTELGATATDTTYTSGYTLIETDAYDIKLDDFGGGGTTPSPSGKTLVLDGFNRANEDPLSNGGKWSSDGYGQFKVVSNQCVYSSGSSYILARWNDAQYGNCEVYLTVITKPENGSMVELSARCASDYMNDYYALRITAGTGTDVWELIYVNGGVEEIILASVNQELTNNDVIGFSVIRSGSTDTLIGYLNGSNIIEDTDTRGDASGYIVFDITGTATVVDNFGGGEVGTIITPSPVSGSFLTSSGAFRKTTRFPSPLAGSVSHPTRLNKVTGFPTARTGAFTNPDSLEKGTRLPSPVSGSFSTTTPINKVTAFPPPNSFLSSLISVTISGSGNATIQATARTLSAVLTSVSITASGNVYPQPITLSGAVTTSQPLIRAILNALGISSSVQSQVTSIKFLPNSISGLFQTIAGTPYFVASKTVTPNALGATFEVKEVTLSGVSTIVYVYVYVNQGSPNKAVKADAPVNISKSVQSLRVNRITELGKSIKVRPISRITKFISDPNVVNTNLISSGGGGVATANFMYDQTPVESPNGVLLVFTLPNSDSYVSGKLEVFIDGLLQLKPTDYSETAPTIFTFTTAPRTDENIRVNYIKA